MRVLFMSVDLRTWPSQSTAYASSDNKHNIMNQQIFIMGRSSSISLKVTNSEIVITREKKKRYTFDLDFGTYFRISDACQSVVIYVV